MSLWAVSLSPFVQKVIELKKERFKEFKSEQSDIPLQKKMPRKKKTILSVGVEHSPDLIHLDLVLKIRKDPNFRKALGNIVREKFSQQGPGVLVFDYPIKTETGCRHFIPSDNMNSLLPHFVYIKRDVYLAIDDRSSAIYPKNWSPKQISLQMEKEKEFARNAIDGMIINGSNTKEKFDLQ